MYSTETTNERNETKRNERTNETKRKNQTKTWLNAAYPSACRRLVRFPKRLCSAKRRRMVPHERPTAIVANDLKRQNPVSAWEDYEPPQKKQIFEVAEAGVTQPTPFIQSPDQVPVFEDDALMELLLMGSQPHGCLDHEDTQRLCGPNYKYSVMIPMHSFQVDGGTQPAETEQTYTAGRQSSMSAVQYCTVLDCVGLPTFGARGCDQLPYTASTLGDSTLAL